MSKNIVSSAHDEVPQELSKTVKITVPVWGLRLYRAPTLLRELGKNCETFKAKSFIENHEFSM